MGRQGGQVGDRRTCVGGGTATYTRHTFWSEYDNTQIKVTELVPTTLLHAGQSGVASLLDLVKGVHFKVPLLHMPTNSLHLRLELPTDQLQLLAVTILSQQLLGWREGGEGGGRGGGRREEGEEGGRGGG